MAVRSAPRWVRWVVPLALVLVWLGIGGTLGPYAGKLGEVATNDQAAFLPRAAESTKVLQARKAFETSASVPAIVVWTTDTAPMTADQRQAATRAVATLAGRPGIAASPSPAVVSDDGEAMQAVVPLAPGLGDELPTVLDEVREATARVPGTSVQIAGPRPVRRTCRTRSPALTDSCWAWPWPQCC